MINRIAQYVQQRLGELVEHIAVDQGIAAFKLQHSHFSGNLAGCADIALQARLQRAHLGHAGTNHQMLQIA